MDRARVLFREQSFRIGVQVMSGAASAAEAGQAFAGLADMTISALAPAALAETIRQGGAFAGEVAVIALGKCGSGEMTAQSDLDLMTLYRADSPDAMSEAKGWGAETFYARFTQRLVAALSAPTGEGELYEVDLQLRPSGTAGPVAVSWAAFEGYYAHEAETWEMMALTRARLVWATSAGFANQCRGAIETALRQPRDPAQTARDMLDMRKLMARERPPKDDWDLKLSSGGMVDIEFAVQTLQLVHASQGGPLCANTLQALTAFKAANLANAAHIADLEQAWLVLQDVSQVLKLALADGTSPAAEPAAFRSLLARSAHLRQFSSLMPRLLKVRKAAHNAFEAIAHDLIAEAGKKSDGNINSD
jgi:glutamate-ammonia-ligase adenylyltransferase